MIDLFRISFSVLDPWSKGDYDEAVRRYLKVETNPTQPMIDGQMLHRQWQDETLKTRSLPRVFGSKILTKPEPEMKLECVIDDWIQFVGIIDCMDGDTIYEYKTGSSNSLHWAGTMQTRCYQVLTELNGYHPTKAIIHHFNQHTNQTTVSKVYLSNNTRELAAEWIRTYASEMREALSEGGNL